MALWSSRTLCSILLMAEGLGKYIHIIDTVSVYISNSSVLSMANTNRIVIVGNTWNHLTVCKQMSSGSFENNVFYKLLAYKSLTHIYTFPYVNRIWYWIIYKGWSAIKKQPNQTKPNISSAQSAGLLNTLTTSLRRGKIPSTRLLDMTINHPMARLQP